MRYYLWIKNKNNKIKPILINDKKQIKDLFYDIEEITIDKINLFNLTNYDFYKILESAPNVHGLYIIRAKIEWKETYKKYMVNQHTNLLISSNLFFQYYKKNSILNTFKADPTFFLRSKKVKTHIFLKSVLDNSMRYSENNNTQLRNLSFYDRMSRSLNKIKSNDLKIMLNKYTNNNYYYYQRTKDEIIEYFIYSFFEHLPNH